MSINAEGSSVSNKCNYLCDFNGLRKKEFERRKLERLDQVRQQSKELSTIILERVRREKHRQIRNIEQIKAKELHSWKQQHVNAATDDYYYCLSNVGDAHAAAQRENELATTVNEEQQKNREIAIMRGRKAMEKEKMKTAKKDEKMTKRSFSKLKKKIDKITEKDVSYAHKDIHDESLVNDKQGQECNDEFIDIRSETPANILTRSQELSKGFVSDDDDNVPAVRFSQISDLIEERKKARNLCEEMLESNAALSEIIPAISPKRKVTHFPISPIHTLRPVVNSVKRTLAPSSKSATITAAKKSPEPHRKSMQLPTQTNKPQPKCAKVNVPVTLRKNAVNTKTTKAPINVSRVVSTRETHSTKPLLRSKSTSPQRREFVPRFTTELANKPGILKKSSSTVITTAANSDRDLIENASKVQFYDHSNRYGKEYVADPGIVQRERDPPTVTAAEAARIQNEKDEVRFRQLEELRQKSQQRGTESLEKNQIRKDYDLLSQQLDVLSKQENNLRTFAMPNEQFTEERIRQMARNRQQNLNREFEEIQHKPVVITCPPVGSYNNSTSSGLNVATSPLPNGDQQRIDLFDSSDSCTSILLGYVDNRSRKLVKDIKQCKDANDRDRSDELLHLLSRLDRLRRLLKEEIKENGSRVASSDLEAFCRSVIELDKKKKEILANGDANKENGDKNNQSELAKREQILKMKEDKLEKKIKELFLKEHKKKRSEDHFIESLTSESSTCSTDRQSEPVKILIEVKNACKVRKAQSSRKVGILSDPTVGSKAQHVPKTVGSSSSTTYRSLPATFQTPLTKVLNTKTTPNKQTKTKTTKISISTKPQTTPVQTPTLVHYITRLLGMSRPSIDQLGVSSSTSIDTPTPSVIENPRNMTPIEIDENHLSKIESVIDDHRRFAEEVDASLSQSKIIQGESENVWMKKLNKQHVEEEMFLKNHQKAVRKKQEEKQKKLEEKMRKQQVEKKSSCNNGQAAKIDEIQPNDVLPTQSDIPENSKRIIADLTKQIEQVRQEKQKLLEKTMSSAHSSNSSSGKGFDSTEYKDFVIPSEKLKSHEAEENNGSSQASDVISLPGHFAEEEPKNLMSTKQIGISFSRDSGIGSSRPVTSTDFRISPDIKLFEKPVVPTTNEPSKALSTDTNPPRESVDPSVKSIPAVSRKSGKPPISLKRFSPQLDTEQLQPHDLSTINEIETSATSRLNPSTLQESSDSSISEKFKRFPTFFEYARLQTNVDADDVASEEGKSFGEMDLKKMLDVTLTSLSDLNYRKLDQPPPDDCKKSDEILTNSDADDDYIDVEEEIMKRNLLATSDVTSSTNSDTKKLTTSSSDVLAKDFNQIGLNWASVMLKKTATAQNLESSSTSSNVPRSESNNNSVLPQDKVNGNPLNIREFLAQELLKRTQSNSSSSMSDNSTLTDHFIRSLLHTSTHSSTPQQATHRTSTPNRQLTGDSDKPVDDENVARNGKEEGNLFSGESYLSSVRGTSRSDDTSGGKETSE